MCWCLFKPTRRFFTLNNYPVVINGMVREIQNAHAFHYVETLRADKRRVLWYISFLSKTLNSEVHSNVWHTIYFGINKNRALWLWFKQTMHLEPSILRPSVCHPLYSSIFPSPPCFQTPVDFERSHQNKTKLILTKTCMHKGCYNLSLVRIPSSVSNITTLLNMAGWQATSSVPVRRIQKIKSIYDTLLQRRWLFFPSFCIIWRNYYNY